MTIPARLFINYIETSESWELRDTSGQKIGHVDRDRLRQLAISESADGVGSLKRLRYVQLRVPLEEVSQRVVDALEYAHKLRKDRERKSDGRLPIETPYCVAEHIGPYTVYKHVASKCSSVDPSREPVNKHCM